MEIKFKNVVYNDYNLDFTIDNKNITGITGTGKTLLLNLIGMNHKIDNGEIYINNKKLKKENINEYRRKVSLIEFTFKYYLNINTVEEYMEYIIRENKLIIKDPNKKINDAIKIVGLEEFYLKKNINKLSKSELKLLQIATGLLSNPDIILLDEPFIELDTKEEKKLYMLLTKLKEHYNKAVVIASINSDKLYKYTTKMLFIKNKKILLEGNTEELYQRVDFLKRNKFEIPDIVLFTYLVRKNKKVNLDYHKDIRDIIKDIYKHV